MEHWSSFSNMLWNMIFTHQNSLIIIIGAIAIEAVARHIKAKNKKIILAKHGSHTEQENDEFYLQYYQKNQIIDFIRVITTIVLIISLFIINTDIGLSFFAVAAGAFVIAFRDFILAVIAFFFVTPQYPIGLTVKVAGVQGQIIFIRMLSVGILGKDEKGENTGELFIVPSHKFMTDIVEKEDLRSTSIFREEVVIPYSPQRFTIDFEDFMKKLRQFLDTNFPVKKREYVGNYLSYAWHRYKIDFFFHDEKYLGIKLSFVGKMNENRAQKEGIMTFVSQHMKQS